MALTVTNRVTQLCGPNCNKQGDTVHSTSIITTTSAAAVVSFDTVIPVGSGILWLVGWFVNCSTSQQHASVSQGRICSDKHACCHTEIEHADQTFYLTQSQYTDTGPTSPSADPMTPGVWLDSHWSANL